MVRRWQLIFWRWIHRIHDRLHQADEYAHGMVGHGPPFLDIEWTTVSDDNVTYTQGAD